MLAEIGHFAIILAFILAFATACLYGGLNRGWGIWAVRPEGAMHPKHPVDASDVLSAVSGEKITRLAAYLICALIFFAFLVLLIAFYSSDFSLAIVAANSHSAKPSLFKLTASWGNHEGSMLLWVLVLSVATAALACFGTRDVRRRPPGFSARKEGERKDAEDAKSAARGRGQSIVQPEAEIQSDTAPGSGSETGSENEFGLSANYETAALDNRRRLVAGAVAVQCVIIATFLAFILFTSNPFARLLPTPADGEGLNPLLQDIGLAIHPPFLYFGYVGLSVPFSLAVAGLLTGTIDRGWAMLMRPFVLIAWAMLTIGIVLGSWWAYYELGWGGWWAWDPVENASFMPWLAATALLHSVRNVEVRGNFKIWTLLLAISAFSLSLVGTFLVRSGILTSVHAFATDPTRGIFVLMILAGLTGGALMVFARHAGRLKREMPTPLLSRENALLINNILLITACATVFLGTFYPLFLDMLTGAKISVGGPYFNIVFTPLAGAMVFMAAIGGLIPWQGAGRDALQAKILGMSVIAASLTLICFVMMTRKYIAGFMAIFLAAWLLTGTLQSLLAAKKNEKLWAARPLWGMILAHGGLAIFVLGVAGISLWQSKQVIFMSEGDSTRIAGLTVTLKSVSQYEGPNFIAERTVLNARKDGAAPALSDVTLIAERRFYPVRGMQTTEAAIHQFGVSDLYITAGARVPGEGWPVTLYFNPFVTLLWIGGGLAAAGGVVSALTARPRPHRPAKKSAARLFRSAHARRRKSKVSSAEGAPQPPTPLPGMTS